MLLSMTGFGDSRYQDERLAAAVEVRTVNNRYLKVITKSQEAYASLDGEIERIVREYISRGTVNVTVRVDRRHSASDYQLNAIALRSYWSQLQSIATEMHAAPPSDTSPLLALPGVVADEALRSNDVQADWQIVSGLLHQALQKLQTFRSDEGRSMERDLRDNAQAIATRLEEVVAHAPQVVAEYRAKLLDRVRQLLKDSNISVNDSDLVREVTVFSDRSDINEENIRLRSHLEQFQAFLVEPVSTGRKLDFLVQEMFRETNTIGSKANNVAIAHCVVEMKVSIEKMREVLQNVE